MAKARTRRGRMVAASTLSLSVVSTTGFLLAGLANRSSFCATQHGLGCGMMASATSVASAGGSTMAAEVQSNGDVTAAAAFAGGAGRGGGSEASGSSPKRRRVSSDVTTRFPITVVEKQPRRLVVIADVHGDLGAFAETLLAAGLVDGTGNWAAGETVLVQAGDVFDRGDADLEVEEWLWTLQEQATESGGAVYHLLGNHEIMNAMGDHSTASPNSFKPFQDLDVDLAPFGSQLDKFPDWGKPRLAAMAPGGPVSKMLASHSVAMKIGDTLLVHGGLRPVNFDPKSCRGATGMACLESLNRWTHEWLVGQGEMPKELWNRDSPVWTRFYSSPGGVELSEEAEADLQKVLDATGTVRMIVGHTPQEAGINSALGGRLWRTDTGMTAMIGGQPEALEIVDGVATIITAGGKRIPGDERACTAGKPLPHKRAVSQAERSGWRGARMVFGQRDQSSGGLEEREDGLEGGGAATAAAA